MDSTQRTTTLQQLQELARSFAQRNGWVDAPNVDKFDHLHEELIEMSQHLRYKSEVERQAFVKEHPEIFLDGIGDLLFGTARLANQLGVDLEEAINLVKEEIFVKYDHQGLEENIVPVGR